MFKRYSINLEQEDTIQYVTGLFILLVYVGALFFPLMDKDAAHHANIALHMVEHNDYISLVDRQMDYLDKPHFLFWVAAASYKIFGVNTFAYRLPAILFALVSIVSTYKLTRHLSNKTNAKIAALMLATAQGFILSINDARMETPLAAAIIFGTWQLIAYIDDRRFKNLILAALGAGIAFSTKGWIGPAIIFISAFFHILVNRKWRVIASPVTWLFVPLFGIFISPVLYAYYQQFDLHPEKVIRNMSHISGVRFILWDQNFERFGGDSFIKGGRNSSVFFLYHTFLWAFFPWCIGAYAALIYWLRRMMVRKKWRNPFNFAALAFGLILFTISFSKFKMPHYIFMLMPLAAIFTAPYVRLLLSSRRAVRIVYPLQAVCAILVLLAGLIIIGYFFPPVSTIGLTIFCAILLAAGVYILNRRTPITRRILFGTALFSIAFNLLLNYDFFPGLLKYQGGNELAAQMKRDRLSVPDDKILLAEINAHSFDFYRGHNHDTVGIAALKADGALIRDRYILLTPSIARDLEASGIIVNPVATQIDYNVARMKLKFLDPRTRAQLFDSLMLVRLERP